MSYIAASPEKNPLTSLLVMRLPTCAPGRFLMSRVSSALLAVSLLCPLTACDPQEDTQTRAIENFTDGMSVDSDLGAFRVTLWSDSGDLEVGRNDLVLR